MRHAAPQPKRVHSNARFYAWLVWSFLLALLAMGLVIDLVGGTPC